MKRKWSKLFCVLLAVLMSLELAACGTPASNTEDPNVKEDPKTTVYSITEENGNKELVMNRQPESSYWFPADLLAWNPEEDPDFIFNVSTVPLAERADLKDLEPVNPSQNKDTKVMAISIMNGSTSGNAPHGLNKADANTFSYWQYVDTLVYWGGSSGEGLIVPPSPDVVDAAHRNGVPVLGTIFLPPAAFGGKLAWMEDLLTKEADGSYPVADKLIQVANLYGFDGWFLNPETEGSEEEPLTEAHADELRAFIAYLKAKAPELEIVYYDSLTVDGEINWQNALTEKNAAFLVDEEGNAVADEMFLNFWWTAKALAEQDLLAASEKLAGQLGVDPYSLYAGVDVQSNGFNTPVRWSLFEKPEGGTHTSLGLYCPSWTYFAANTPQKFWANENAFWVNANGDPRQVMDNVGEFGWKGISAYTVERTPVTKLPFITNFSLGNGYGFYKEGKLISRMDWNNRSLADILPTYRYILDNGEGNKLDADLDIGDAYYGGNDLMLVGAMKKGVTSSIKLYSASLPLTDKVFFTTAARSRDVEVALDAVLTLEDGSEVVLKGDKPVGSEWTVVSYDVSELAGKTVKEISYQLTAAEDVTVNQFRIGNITIAETGSEETATVSNVQVLDTEFDEDEMYAGVRLSWETDVPTDYYEVYRINEDGSKSLLGVSNTTSFYVNTLPRTDKTNQSTFEIVPVNAFLEEGTSATASMQWPDISLPKAGFTADITLAAPGTTITFTGNCSLNTEKVTWTLPGSDKETAEGETVSVTYAQEGVYPVTVKAENEFGSNEASKEAYIVITSGAAEGLKLLSQGAATEADAFVNDNEAPAFAVDGDITKKWCATGPAPHYITIDLGQVRTVSAVDVSHAEAGGEGAGMNTKSYAIEVSEDGVNFTQVKAVTRNNLGKTHDAFAPVNARYVKLVVNKPTQGSDSAARIYEVEVFGLEDALK